MKDTLFAMLQPGERVLNSGQQREVAARLATDGVGLSSKDIAALSGASIMAAILLRTRGL